MAEYILGRIKFVYQGDWTTGTRYIADDIVTVGGKSYICVTGHLAAVAFATDLAASNWEIIADGLKWRSTWTATTLYNPGDLVKYGAVVYQCNTGHTSGATLELDQGKWETFANGTNYRSTWVNATAYSPGDLVTYGGNVYYCATGHTSATSTATLTALTFGVNAGTATLTYSAQALPPYAVGSTITLAGFTPTDTSGTVNAVNASFTVVTCTTTQVTFALTGTYTSSVLGTVAGTSQLGLEKDQSKWQLFNAGVNYRGDFAASTRYRVNDLVKSGANTYICLTGHTSGANIDTTGVLFDTFVAGLEFESSWSNGTAYQIGDLATYGGYTYVAIQNNTAQNPSTATAYWTPITTGWTYEGDWNNSTYYKISSVVRLGGYTYLSTVDSPTYTLTATATTPGVAVTISATSGTSITVSSTSGLVAGAKITVASDIGNLLRFNTYYILAGFSANQFSVSSTPGGPAVALSTTTAQNVVATTQSFVTTSATTDLEAGQAITFASSFGGIVSGATYYILDGLTDTQFNIGAVANGAQITLTTTTSQTVSATFTAQPGNTAYWSRLNPGLYWKNTSQTYTGVATSNVLVTNGAAAGAAYTVVRNGTVYTLTRTGNGTNYTTGDTIKILGTDVGGLSPVNDITITVTASAGAITAETLAGVAVTWTGGTNYVLGDVATMGANSYVCVLPHFATATNSPNVDTQAVYWNLLSAGAEVATLTTAGDTFYYGPNGPARLPVGSVGQVLRSDGAYPTWDNFGHIDKIVYVGPNGVDAPAPVYGQTIDTPWASVRYAAKQIEEGYLNPNAKQLLATNKQFIMKEVTNFINYTYTVSITQTIAAGNNFVTASTANLNVGMPIKFTGTVFGNVVEGTTYYVKTINVNGTNFTVSETYEGIEFALASDTGTMAGTLSYIQDTCERDTGIIVDALIFDLTHGGNQKATAAANSYYVPSSNTYITTALGRQVPQSIAGYNYMKTLVGLVLANQAPGTSYQTLNGVATQAMQHIDTAYTVETGVPATATALISIVTNGLAGGATSAIPTAINPATTISVKTGTYNEVLPIVVPNYTAVVGDELRSSIIQPKAANPLLVNDKAKTSSALTRFKTIMPTLMANGAVTATSGNTQTQVTSLPAGSIGSTTAVSRVVANATIMYDVINNGAGSIPTYTLPAPTGHNTSLTNTAYATTGNTTGSTAGYGDAVTQVSQNKQFIKDELSDWLAAVGNGYSSVWAGMNQVNFQTNIGYAIDAIVYDLTYGGNTQTLSFGSSYYVGYTLTIPTTEKAATVAAYTWLKSFIDNIAVKDTAGWVKTTGSSQVVTGTAGSANSGSFAQDRVQEVIDWINNQTAPTAIAPCVTAAAYSTALVDSFTALQARRTEIQRDSTVWVKKYFQEMNFIEPTCYRDVGYIVDALSYDLLTGSNFASSKAAESYLRGVASAQYVLANQKTASLGLINFIMYKAKQTAAAGASTEAQNLIDDIVATINGTQLITGLGVQTHGTLSYNNTLATIQGAEILRANKEFLAYEATAFITASYGGTVTTTTAATNLFTLGSAHNFVAGDPVVFLGTTYAGSGITVGTTYYVLAAGLTGTAFTVSATAGGTAIDITSNGSGSTLVVRYSYDAVSCRRDMREWVEALIYDLQYTGNYRARRAAELYVNAINGSQLSDMFLVANASGLRNCTLSGLSGALTAPNQYGTKRPTAGAYVALNPGFGPNDSNNWVTTRSHYSQNVTMFGTGCTGAKIDAALHAGGNKSMVKNDFTTILSDGIGVWCTGSGSLTELVSVFNYYGYSGYLAELGGRIRATNGNSSYGTYGVIAEGLDTYEVPGYANLNNRGQQAYITNTVTDGANQILRIEYNNAGIDYTNANFVINGSGFNAVAVGDEFRDYGVFETRLVDLNDGFGFGGAGYLTATNTGQSGTATSIVIAAADTGLSQSYAGMQVIITAGTGAGQYARIAAYNSGTKTALVYKPNFVPLTVTGTDAGANTLTVASTARLYVGMPIYLGTAIAGLSANTLYYVRAIPDTTTFTVSTTVSGGVIFDVNATLTGQTVSLLAAGWEHVVPGTPIQPVLDLTAIYVIEPAVNYSAPGYTATATTLVGSAEWASVDYAAGYYVAVGEYSAATAFSTDGKTWQSGGVQPQNRIWNEVRYGGGQGATATAVVGGLGGSGGIFTVTRTGTQITSVAVAHGGSNYTTAPTLVVSGGGGSGAILTCSVLNGSITDVQVIVNGSGYTSNPTVSVDTSVLTSIAVDTWGKDYTSTPTVTISDPFTGTAWSSGGASVVGNYYFHINTSPTPNVKNWYRATSTAGLGTVAPIVTTGITGSNSNLTYVGTTAIGVPALTNQGLSSISILTVDNGNPGAGYTSTPTVTILDPNAKFVAISAVSANPSSYQTVAGLVAGSPWVGGAALPPGGMDSLAFGIISGTPIWLAVGGTANGAVTNDGATWTTKAPPTTGGTYSAVDFNGSVFVAIASGDSLSSIYNGSTWSAGGALPTSTTWSSIAFGNGRFVAVASGGRNAAYSIDAGATWLASPAGLPSSQSWSKVSYGQGLFIAIASGTSVCATSPDGVVWTERALPSSSQWYGLTFGNPGNDPLWVAVSGTTGGNVACVINTGATPIARAKVFSNAVTEIRIAEPGSGYSHGNVTQTGGQFIPGVIITNNTENLANLQPVEFIGCSASGLAENTTYYVIGSTIISNNSFEVASTLANAALGTAVQLNTTTGLTGSYRAKPTVTVTDPNSTRTVPTRARMGTGVLGNPTFTNRGTNNATASSSATGDGYSDIYQASSFINVTNVYSAPLAGSNVTFASIPGVFYKLVQVNNISGSAGNFTATFQINPALTVLNAPAHTELITTKLKYSQVRLTGHDFLYIGTGNVAQTNYPYVNISTAVQSQQANSSGGGRVFFTSTDQDGNFNVGNLFSVQQATGTATLNATAFNLSGLQSLQLGSLNVGVGSATINQFSTDPYFTANSDNVLPTQRAIRSYINSQIGGGQSSLNVNTLTSGVVYIANNTITTTTGVGINVKTKMNFTGGIDGAPVALQFFFQR